MLFHQPCEERICYEKIIAFALAAVMLASAVGCGTGNPGTATLTNTSGQTEGTELSDETKLSVIDPLNMIPYRDVVGRYEEYYRKNVIDANSWETYAVMPVFPTDIYMAVHCCDIPRWFLAELFTYFGIGEVYDREYLNCLYSEIREVYNAYLLDHFEEYAKELVILSFEYGFVRYLYNLNDKPRSNENLKFLESALLRDMIGLTKESLDKQAPVYSDDGQYIGGDAGKRYPHLWAPINEVVNSLEINTLDEFLKLYDEYKAEPYLYWSAFGNPDYGGISVSIYPDGEADAEYYEFCGVRVYASELPQYSWFGIKHGGYYSPYDVHSPADVYRLNKRLRITP